MLKRLNQSHFVARFILVVVLSAAAWAGFTYIPEAPTSEMAYDIDDADIAVQLQKDGSLLVQEELEFDFHGSFTGAYRDILLNKPARITDVQLLEDGERYEPGGNTTLGSYDRSGTFGTEIFDGTSDFDGAGDTSGAEDYSFQRVVWHYDAADEKREFLLVYRVKGAANVRDDVVDVTWTIWGDQWDFWLDSLDARISAESGVAPIRTSLQPRSLGVDSKIVDDYAEANVDRVPSQKAVGMRAVFPRDAISSTRGATVDPGDGLAGIDDDIAELDDELSALTKFRNWATDNTPALTIVLALLGIGGVIGLILMARERPVDVPEYLPEPPEDVPPALALQLATEGQYDQSLVLATLMDLVDRGYFDAKPSEGKDLDLLIHKGEDRPSANTLEKYEISVMDFFDKLIGGAWVAIGEMKDKVPEHSTAWRNRWESMNEKLDDAETNYLTWDRDLSRWRTILALVVFLLFALLVFMEFNRTNRGAVPVTGMVFTIGFLISIPTIWLKRLATAPRLRSAQWRAFREWTRDFPRLDDDPPATLQLWRRILVYAVAFGTAERIAKSGKIPEPVVAEAGGIWAGYAFHNSVYFNSFDSFGSGFSSQVAPQSSSGGSSGFSGGGGGGFSGGGGGGAW